MLCSMYFCPLQWHKRQISPLTVMPWLKMFCCITGKLHSVYTTIEVFALEGSVAFFFDHSGSNPSNPAYGSNTHQKGEILPASTSLKQTVQRQLKCWAWLTSLLLSAACPLSGRGNSHPFPHFPKYWFKKMLLSGLFIQQSLHMTALHMQLV